MTFRVDWTYKYLSYFVHSVFSVSVCLVLSWVLSVLPYNYWLSSSCSCLRFQLDAFSCPMVTAKLHTAEGTLTEQQHNLGTATDICIAIVHSFFFSGRTVSLMPKSLPLIVPNYWLSS